MTNEQIEKLIEKYVNRIIDNMDIGEMAQFIYDDLYHDYTYNYSESELIELINSDFPELLENKD